MADEIQGTTAGVRGFRRSPGGKRSAPAQGAGAGDDGQGLPCEPRATSRIPGLVSLAARMTLATATMIPTTTTTTTTAATATAATRDLAVGVRLFDCRRIGIAIILQYPRLCFLVRC